MAPLHSEGSTLVATPTPARHLPQDIKNYDQKLKEYVDKVQSFKLPAVDGENNVRHSGPQGKVEPLTIIDDPADWKAADWQGREEEYIYHFTDEDVKELTTAVDDLKARGVKTEDDILALTKDDFPLPTLGDKLQQLYQEVNGGKGFHLVRGFPVKHYEQDRVGLVLAFWALGLHLGRPLVSQTDYNKHGQVYGSVLNHVTAGRWANVYKRDEPLYQGRQLDINRLAFHSDQGATDLIALLSIGAAKEGGESKWVSSIAIHNELLRRGRKDLVEVLSQPKLWLTPLKNDQAVYLRNPDGSFKGFEEVIPFEYHDGYLTIHFENHKYQDTKLTPLQEEAVWAVSALAESPEFHLSLKLQPGDLEIIHNPTIFHARTEVKDGEDRTQRRHLLRWWVHGHNNKRPIAPHFAPRSNVQPQGGFTVPEGSKLRLPLYPYSQHDGLGQSPADVGEEE